MQKKKKEKEERKTVLCERQETLEVKREGNAQTATQHGTSEISKRLGKWIPARTLSGNARACTDEKENGTRASKVHTNGGCRTSGIPPLRPPVIASCLQNLGFETNLSKSDKCSDESICTGCFRSRGTTSQKVILREKISRKKGTNLFDLRFFEKVDFENLLIPD